MFEWFKNLFSNKQPKEESADPAQTEAYSPAEEAAEEEAASDDEDDQSAESQSESEAEDRPSGLVVGEILEINEHPNADKLVLARVNIGDETLDIVCGADNIKPGDKVPVALAGTTLPNGMEIKAAEIRGEKSNGMLCAEDELELGDDHSGILILPVEAEVGKPIDQYIK